MLRHSSQATLACGSTPCLKKRPFSQGQKLLRIDFDTSAGDETYTTLKASLEMAKQLTKVLAEALICGREEEGEGGGKGEGKPRRKVVVARKFFFG